MTHTWRTYVIPAALVLTAALASAADKDLRADLWSGVKDAIIGTDKRADGSVCGQMSDGATIVNDLTTEPAIGILSASMFRAGEGTYNDRPATCPVLTFYFATDTQTLCIYSPTLGEWIEK